MLTLFQCMTFDHWAMNIIRRLNHLPVMQFAIQLYMVIGAYCMMSIVIGAIVANVFHEAKTRDQEADHEILMKQSELLLSLRDFFMACDFDGNGELELEELEAAMQSPVLVRVMKEVEIPFSTPQELFRALDSDRSGSITFDEFVMGIIKLKHPAEGKDVVAMQVNLARSLQVLCFFFHGFLVFFHCF